MSDDLNIPEAVRRGYDALIAAGHTPEAIRAAVFADDFDMARCDRCVIGQLFEFSAAIDDFDLGRQYHEALRGLGVDQGFRYGFGYVYDTHENFEALAEEWRRLVAEKADAPTIAPSALSSHSTGGVAHPGPAGGVSDIAAATAATPRSTP